MGAPVHKIEPAAREADPLLAALIGKLPPSGASWPATKRAAWLELMWKTFDLVYADDGEGAIEMPSFLRAKAGSAPAPRTAAAAEEPVIATDDKPFVKMGGHAFYIDRAGRACRAGGSPIMPADIGADRLYDMRGEGGDLGAIQWADGTTGVRGLQLDISPA